MSSSTLLGASQHTMQHNKRMHCCLAAMSAMHNPLRPHLLMRPSEGLSPTSAQWLAGPRTELPVSVPSAAMARLAAMAAAEPPLEPAGE